MAPADDIAAVVARYRRFALEEAPGRSAVYADWAAQVGEDEDLAALLARVAPGHRQPPLVFAVARLLGCGLVTGAAWAEWMRAHADAVVAECGRRRVQTNEPLRCAALLPALALIDGPIALLEVGASAGLCLYPDRYSYRYETPHGEVRCDPPDGPSPVVLRSRWISGLRDGQEKDAAALPPRRMPEVVWRAGIDLDPLDPTASATREWLTGLVWPGETGRAERIAAALRIAASEPPLLVAADAASGAIATLAARAPREATLVVTTPGVLPYLSRAARPAVIAQAREAGRWITLDEPGTHEAWDEPPTVPEGAFALALDGVVLAAADPLGRFVEWRASGEPVPG